VFVAIRVSSSTPDGFPVFGFGSKRGELLDDSNSDLMSFAE